MQKVAIITDSEAGFESEQEGLFIIPMPFIIDGEEYFENVNISYDKFFEILESDTKITTSQPSYDEIVTYWKKALESYDEVVYIPMSSSLSSSCFSATTYAEADFDGKVFVVDNKRISTTQKTSVLEALELAKQGKSGKEIKEFLENTQTDNSIYITIPTLKYLKRGGRITPAAAALGTLLGIKPILQIQGGKLDTFAKVMNMNQAKQKMINAIKKDIETRFADLAKQGKLVITVVHSNNLEQAKKFKEEVEKAIPNIKVAFLDELSLSVTCHIGPGSLAITVSRI